MRNDPIDPLLAQIKGAAELVNSHRASFPNPDWTLAALYRAIALAKTEGPEVASEYLIAALGPDWRARIDRTASQASPSPTARPLGAFDLSAPLVASQGASRGWQSGRAGEPGLDT